MRTRAAFDTVEWIGWTWPTRSAKATRRTNAAVTRVLSARIKYADIDTWALHHADLVLATVLVYAAVKVSTAELLAAVGSLDINTHAPPFLRALCGARVLRNSGRTAAVLAIQSDGAIGWTAGRTAKSGFKACV